MNKCHIQGKVVVSLFTRVVNRRFYWSFLSVTGLPWETIIVIDFRCII